MHGGQWVAQARNQIRVIQINWILLDLRLMGGSLSSGKVDGEGVVLFVY